MRCGADDRQALKQLCRTITRPALANERVQTNTAGQVVLKLKTPWRDGTTHLVMSPLEFMQRLAALVPRPRLHLIRFHGVLAPNAGAAVIGCARASHRRDLAPHRPGKHQGKGYERYPSGLRSVFNGLRPRPRATRVRVRELGGGVPGGKRAFEWPILRTVPTP